MKIADFITQHTHLTNEEMLIEAMRIAYNEGWKHRGPEEDIQNYSGDIYLREDWLNSLL